MQSQVWAQEANTADWIAAIGQAAGALFTAAAVIVALGIAISDGRRRRREEEERAKRNARMVLVRGTGVRSDAGRSEEGYQHRLLIYFTNHGDRPIFNVYAEAWAPDNALTEPPRWAVTSEIVLPGEPAEPHEYFMLKVTTKEPELRVAAWRVRWTDIDGRQWYGDRARQYQPLLFAGQTPVPNGTDDTSLGG